MRYQDGESGFAVVLLETAEGPVTAAGDLGEVEAGAHLRVHGRWEEHPRFGRQFRVAWVERLAPTTLEGLARYLASGAFPGVGPTLARRIVEHFGAGTLEALEAGAERIREVPGVGAGRAATLARIFQENRDRHRVLAELRGLGLGAAQAAALYERWQAGAVERVRRDPYALIEELRGLGFQTAERMARQLGIPQDSPARARGVLLHLLREAAREGHVCLPGQLLARRFQALGLGEERLGEAAAALHEAGRVVVEPLPGGGGDGRGAEENRDWYYLAGLWEAEVGVAEHVARLLRTPTGPVAAPEQVLAAMRRSAFQPDPSQREALEMALTRPFAVLTGGPGTGKTTTLRLLLEVLHAAGVEPVRLASPTGRAAKRLQEATGHEASTIHRLLGYDPRQDGFRHDEDAPLDAAFLVVDEVSMLDLPLAHALLRAVPPGCRVLLVGDADQLPSVGPGAVLRDLVAAPAVPTVRLRRIHRQEADSGIVEAAHAILAGEVPEGAPRGSDGDFFVARPRDPEVAAELVERLVCERIPARYGLDPHQDVLVLSPMYRGPLGVDQLNERLARRLNPDGSGPAWAAPFRVGDRVMVVRNDYEREVFNGDTGRVAGFTREEMLVEVDGRPLLYKKEQLQDLVPAWCVTVHRAQGSEAPAVVVVLGRGHYVMLRRNLLYTAVTRGRRLVVLVADPAALWRAVRNAEETRRFGLLEARLATPNSQDHAPCTSSP